MSSKGTATTSTLPLPSGVSGGYKFRGIAKGDDGKLYCAPWNASVVLVIDTAAGTTSTLPLLTKDKVFKDLRTAVYDMENARALARRQ